MTKKPAGKRQANERWLALRPAETDPGGRLRAACIYARRRLAFFQGKPDYEKMAAALAPAFEAIDSTPPDHSLAQADADTVNFALDEFRALCEGAATRQISDARAADERRRRSHGGKARAQNRADQLIDRDNRILADRTRLLSDGTLQHELAGKLTGKYGLTASTIRKIFKKAGVS